MRIYTIVVRFGGCENSPYLFQPKSEPMVVRKSLSCKKPIWKLREAVELLGVNRLDALIINHNSLLIIKSFQFIILFIRNYIMPDGKHTSYNIIWFILFKSNFNLKNTFKLTLYYLWMTEGNIVLPIRGENYETTHLESKLVRC